MIVHNATVTVGMRAQRSTNATVVCANNEQRREGEIDAQKFNNPTSRRIIYAERILQQL